MVLPFDRLIESFFYRAQTGALPLPLLLPGPRGRGLLGSLLRRLVAVDLLLPALRAAERGVASVHEDVLVSLEYPLAAEAGVEVVVSGHPAGPRRRRQIVQFVHAFAPLLSAYDHTSMATKLTPDVQFTSEATF